MKTNESNGPPSASPLPPVPGRSPAAAPAEMPTLRLFVAGASEQSRQAVREVRKMCAAELQAGCKLEVIDIYQQPELAQLYHIVATPTLIREPSSPTGRSVGSLQPFTPSSGRLPGHEKGNSAG